MREFKQLTDNMSRIPISIDKIKVCSDRRKVNETRFLVNVSEKGNSWKKTFNCKLDDLKKLKEEIDKIISSVTLAESLNISEEAGRRLEELYKKDSICKNCKYKPSHSCVECAFELQSPLERKLFIALKDEYIKFSTQYALNWNGENISMEGKEYNNPLNNFREVLSVADFYIEKSGERLCVYTDGHTYHERTEEQAQHDRRIDRKLQELGFTVLRYTGKDVNENLQGIVRDIKGWIG